MLRGTKFRLYPNREQQIQLNKTLGCARFVYNHFLEARKKTYHETGKSPSYVETARMLTYLKKELDWLREADSIALQQALRHLDTSYSNFFRKQSGYPRFKSKKDKQSYTTMNNGPIKIEAGKVYLPKAGYVKVKQSREINGKITSATVSRTKAGKYYVSFKSDEAIKPMPKTKKAVGIDLGYRNIVAFSDGRILENPKWLHSSMKKLRREQRRLSRKDKGSRNREKQRLKLARVHEHIAWQRRDCLQKLTTDIVRENQTICIEDLNVKEMQKNKHVAPYICDVGMYEFRRELEYKTEWYGRQLIVVDRAYPSSKTCSGCGYVKENLGTQEKWICPGCGASHHRDINAAKNILAEGLRAA